MTKLLKWGWCDVAGDDAAYQRVMWWCCWRCCLPESDVMVLMALILTRGWSMWRWLWCCLPEGDVVVLLMVLLTWGWRSGAGDIHTYLRMVNVVLVTALLTWGWCGGACDGATSGGDGGFDNWGSGVAAAGHDGWQRHVVNYHRVEPTFQQMWSTLISPKPVFL